VDSRRITPLVVLAIGAALVVGACGSDDEGPIPQTGERQTTTTAEATTTTTAATTTTTTTAPAPTTTTTASAGASAAGDGDTLEMLVDDDGFAAGADMVVQALR
jgi:ABC-type glycerol-3-phosphate transport system substrate-binding protein